MCHLWVVEPLKEATYSPSEGFVLRARRVTYTVIYHESLDDLYAVTLRACLKALRGMRELAKEQVQLWSLHTGKPFSSRRSYVVTCQTQPRKSAEAYRINQSLISLRRVYWCPGNRMHPRIPFQETLGKQLLWEAQLPCLRLFPVASSDF